MTWLKVFFLKSLSGSRDIIRNSWGNTSLPHGEVKIIFVMGTLEEDGIREEVCNTICCTL